MLIKYYYLVNIRFQLVQYHDSSAIKKYFSPRIVQEIHKQMCESVLYKCEQLPLNEAFEFIDDQLDQDEFNEYNANSNDDQIDMSNQNEEKIENIEDYYDFRQIYLKALISSVLRKLIKEVWYVIPYMLMPIRWFHDSVWNCIDSIFDEPFIGISSKSLNQIQVNDIQKLNFILRLIGHFKQALDYLLEDNN
ncbi:unnamed protein product [Rhizophagus irregularis]|nr:unnamed protein product [Rhizophagus irregularis]